MTLQMIKKSPSQNNHSQLPGYLFAQRRLIVEAGLAAEG